MGEVLARESAIPRPAAAPREPVWKGPVREGITFSMLCRYLTCKERSRLYFMEGLKTANKFDHRIEYGQMWHVCEQALAARRSWQTALKTYCMELIDKYRMEQGQVEKWFQVCHVQFPQYVAYWAKHKDVTERTPLLQEAVFRAVMTLPSGRRAVLRGKMDSVDWIGKKPKGGTRLKENKTKGQVQEGQLQRQLTFDLQTMIYLCALDAGDMTVSQNGRPVVGWTCPRPIVGVCYNVVRRPLSGGKGSIKQKEGETHAAYYARLAQYIADEPHTYFMRWNVEVAPSDITRFWTQTLAPLLENLCDDYEWWEWCRAEGRSPFDHQVRIEKFPNHCPRHYRHPFGVRNVLDEGGAADLDEFLMTGSEVGLVRTETLFGELQ